MYKVGDRVETYKEIRSLKGVGLRHVKGRIVEVHADTLTISFDEPWPYGAMQLVFRTKDLLATDVLRLRVGDKVKTSEGDVGVVTSLHNKQRGDVSVRLTSHSDSFTYQLEELTKIDDPDEGGQRWSFKSNKDTFDGARVIRELLNAGADYAVVTVDGHSVGLWHERLAQRAKAVGVSLLAGHSWSDSQVTQLTTQPDCLRVLTVTKQLVPDGYRALLSVWKPTRLDGMVAELEKKEAEAKQFVTHVEWGKAGK